ncbi:MAG TPA: glycoside hydrolase family 127 protein, partial [Ferruginibacter sp.]|nr:glycoside hydrolase family 127 protein [Ferruginibacter sp.]
DKPVAQQSEAVGHAVRAGYLYSAVADVAALTGDDSLTHAIDRIWENVVSKKIYVQGSVGAIGDGERYGANYELPNNTAYNETCAAIANVYWNYRMFLLHGDAKYMDVLEKTLYNGLISGVGLDGKSFFYTNAMEIRNSFSHPDMERERSGWFECSCCPTNICRFVPAIPGYMYAQKGSDLFVNLFISSTADLTINDKQVQVIQQNNYPWDGGLKFTINTARPNTFRLHIRIPGWAQNQAIPSSLYVFMDTNPAKPALTINGEPVNYTVTNGYAVLDRAWKKGARIELNLPMEVRKVVADAQIKNNIGKVALQRGPVMYCAEWADNQGKASNIIVPANTGFSAAFKPELLNGVETIRATVPVVLIGNDETVSTQRREVTFIPYCAWANRGKGEMMVWFPAAVKDIELFSK